MPYFYITRLIEVEAVLEVDNFDTAVDVAGNIAPLLNVYYTRIRPGGKNFVSFDANSLEHGCDITECDKHGDPLLEERVEIASQAEVDACNEVLFHYHLNKANLPFPE